MQKVMIIHYGALNESEFNIIYTCSFAKEIWDTLKIIYEGIDEVKESKINIERASLLDVESLKSARKGIEEGPANNSNCNLVLVQLELSICPQSSSL